MRSSLKIIILIAIITAAILFINYKIDKHDMAYYSGKDDGLSMRFEATCILSVIFYMAMLRNKLSALFVGLAVAILSGLISLILAIVFFNYNGLYFHVLACGLFIAFFFVIKKRFPNLT